MKACRYLLRGRVQGVGFRYFVAHLARRLEVSGEVRNLPDGSVEVLAAAGEEALVSFEAELRQGPPGSRVESVERSELPPTSWKGFHITR